MNRNLLSSHLTMLATSDTNDNGGRVAFCFSNSLAPFHSHCGNVRLPSVLSIIPESLKDLGSWIIS